MNRLQVLKAALAGSASLLALTQPTAAKSFDVPAGDLSVALVTYIKQSDTALIYADSAVRGHKSRGARGDYTQTAALTQILKGTGFTAETMPSNAIAIVPTPEKPKPEQIEVAQAAPRKVPATDVETVVVTAEKKKENIQQVPIAITALTQQQLTERQVAGGPDLVKEVPNLTFSKTNFTGYNIEIRGIGTQAISVTTDPAVAVAFNDTPFIRNHFFEQEFFDVQDVEVLRGPQGTLYGRNATAGVVDIKSALPTDRYEAMMSADLGNYSNRRLEGMLNIPVVSDKLDIRIAGEWTKREGYTEDQELDTNVDGRDLWSGRVTIGWKPFEKLQTDLVWEHFNEDDDRMRSAKQLCEKDPGPTSVGNLNILTSSSDPVSVDFNRTWLSQGCLPTSLYSSNADETPNGQVLPFVSAGEFLFSGNSTHNTMLNPIDPYADQSQPASLREIQSLILPHYRAKNDTLEFNADYQVTPELTLTSQTGYSHDFLYSTEDFNRFDTAPGIFAEGLRGFAGGPSPVVNGVYCDPQLGCSNAMVGEDLSQERAWQFSQEVRLASKFEGPINISFGGYYTHYQTVEDYYVLFNLITAEEQAFNSSGPGAYDQCKAFPSYVTISPQPYFDIFNGQAVEIPSNFACTQGSPRHGTYIDPNPIGQINGQGHNYFRSENPYQLNSLAGFGEAYYQVTPDLKLTGGLRWTDDAKRFTDIPSQVYLLGGGYPVAGIVNQEWKEFTGRAVADWTPQVDFTDATLLYASYSRGYKAGGANPPGPETDLYSSESYATHPPTFAPEFINAYELGTKNTLLDGRMTLNGNVFYYDYKGYQISQIVDRTSINLNFNAKVEGVELESTWEPVPGLRFNFAGGWENTSVDKGQSAVDLMDRTAGMPGWVVVRPNFTDTSNCILPANLVAEIIRLTPGPTPFDGLADACDIAYNPQSPFSQIFGGNDRAAFAAGSFNPATAPNGGAGFAKNLSGNKLPNAPPFTLSSGAQYSMRVSEDWLATLRADFYWQGNQYARIFNDKPFDSIHGYTNLNLALLLDSQNGWDVMFYIKNVFDVTAITGAFLNSDDTALSTNVFATDPRLFGVRVTKHLDENEGFWGSDYSGSDFFTGLFSDKDGKTPVLWIEVGGAFDRLDDSQEAYLPPFTLAGSRLPFITESPAAIEKPPATNWDGSVKVSLQPSDSDWIFAAAIQYGRTSHTNSLRQQTSRLDHYASSQGEFVANQTTTATNSESHMVIDFQAGRDVGLGMFGSRGQSLASVGLRYAQFQADRATSVVYQPTNSVSGYHKFVGSLEEKRRFVGIGPFLSWDASADLLSDSSGGGVFFDWGANGAVLFGRQHAHGHSQTSNINVTYGLANVPVYQRGAAINRAKEVMVPNLGGFAGFSWRYQNAKVSFGYRADEFFGAMDGGIDKEKSENVGFFGPYAKISIGFGG